ncbi:MAG: IMP dehydrogenase [Candidatus Woesearchaeota archaeon]
MGHRINQKKLLGELALKEFGYDDVLVAQNRKTNFLEKEIDLTTYISTNIKLKIPIVSAAMDTVTEHEMAIALALLGGIGVLHYNFGPNLEENISKQLEEAKKVKRFKGGFVENPITLSPNHTIDDAVEIKQRCGISTIPITEDGSSNGKLVGLLTKYDYSPLKHKGQQIKARMMTGKAILKVKLEELERGPKSPLEIANDILLESHKPVLCVVENTGKLVYLVTKSDIEKFERYPLATKDKRKRLSVLAAVETRKERALERMSALKDYVDGFVIDSAHAYFEPVARIIKEAKRKFPEKDIIAGNVSMPNAVRWLVELGIDSVRVGNGPGEGCKTWDVAGTGREQVSAIYYCALELERMRKKTGKRVYLNADGGIKYSGDITVALAAGADTVTLGYLLAGTNEAPGEFDVRGGMRVKEYRGMGSLAAMKKGGALRYSLENSTTRVPEGGVELVKSRGSVFDWLPFLIQGLKQGMFKAGCRTIPELHAYAKLLPANKRDKRELTRFVDEY